MTASSHRVLYVVGAFPRLPCGVGDYTYRLAQLLARRGTDVHVLTSRHPQILRDKDLLGGVQVHPVVSSWSLSSVQSIHRHIQSISPDIVHVQYPANFGRANRSLLANALGFVVKTIPGQRPYVVTTLHEFGERRRRWRARAILNVLSSDLVICVNQFDVRALERLTVQQKRITYVPLASAIAVSPVSSDQRTQIRKSLGLSPKDIAIAYFGFLTPFKGFEGLLSAVHQLKTEGWPVKLLVLTRLAPGENDYHRRILALIDQLALRDVCLLSKTHYSEEVVSRYLQAAEMAVFPFTEGASERRSSLLAALAHGIPTITTYGPNTPPSFVDGSNMLLVPVGKPDAIAHAVKRLARNPDLVARLAYGARQLSQQFSWDNVVERTLQSYETLRSSVRVSGERV